MPSKRCRLVERKNISIPLQFRSATSNNEIELGLTVNVSEHGIYFIASRTLDVGEPLEMFFKLPRTLVGDMAEEVRCSGHVIHVESDGKNGEASIGVKIERFETVSESKWFH
jgi:hypothetical protein